MEHKDLHSLCVSVQELLHRGEVDAAEQQIHPALVASPSDPNLIFLAGNCAMVRGKDEKAPSYSNKFTPKPRHMSLRY